MKYNTMLFIPDKHTQIGFVKYSLIFMQQASFFILMHCFFAIFIGMLLALIYGQLTPFIAYISLLFSLILAAGCVKKTPLTPPATTPVSSFLIIRLGYWIAVGFIIFMISINSFFVFYEEDNALQTLLGNNFGDLPLHIHFIRSIAGGVAFWPDSPIMAGTPLLYPLGVDFYSALLECIGIPLHWHLRGIAFVLSLVFLYLLHCWGGWLLVFAFFFNNAFSGFTLKADMEGWISFYLSLFIPQRSFQLAFPLGVLILWQWKTFYLNSQWNVSRCVGIIILGLLPMIHFHTFLFILGFLGINWLYRRDVHLYLSLLIASVLFIPLVAFLTGGGDKTSAVNLMPGWLDWGWQTPFMWFKSSLWFTFLSLGLIVKGFQKKLFNNVHLVYAVYVFLLMNCVTVAYWNWDNIKVLSWAFLLWVWALKDLMEYASRHLIWKATVFCFAFTIAISGTLHLNKYLWMDSLRLYEVKEVNEIKPFLEDISPDAIFAAEPTHNHPLSFFGQPLLMGHSGHLWTHGMTFTDTENIINSLFLNSEIVQDPHLLEQTLKDKEVSYIYYGKMEKNRGPLRITPSMKLVFKGSDMEIYSLSH